MVISEGVLFTRGHYIWLAEMLSQLEFPNRGVRKSIITQITAALEAKEKDFNSKVFLHMALKIRD